MSGSSTPAEERILGALSSLAARMDQLESRIPSRVSFKNAVVDGSSTPAETFHSASSGEDQFENGDDFSFDRRRSQRFSMGSNGGGRDTASDGGTKIERPKFAIKLTKTEDGVKQEILQDSDILDYLDAYDHFFAMWKTLPANEGMAYPNEARVPIINVPPTYAKQICRRVKCMYDATDLTFCNLGRVQAGGRSWKTLTSAELRKALGELVELEVSHKGALDSLRRVKFKSSFGPIDMTAFATYQHDFKKEVLRLQAGGRALDKIQLKDIIIAAYPHSQYQSELIAQYGACGILVGDVQDFAINDVFDSIERHITNITKEGVRSVVNKFIRAQEAQNSYSPRTPSHGGARATGTKAIHNTELSELFDDASHEASDSSYPQGHQVDESHDSIGVPLSIDEHVSSDEWQMLVNAAVANGQNCSRCGKGPDGLLLCKFLGGPKESCIFKHPEEDYKLKGKGFSTARPFVKSTKL
jgi:hypothetical protein